MPKRSATSHDNSLQLKIDSKIYPLEAILTTTYHFIDDFYAILDRQGGSDRIIVNLKCKKSMSKTRLGAMEGEFQNTLLAEALRLDINKRHAKLRERIVEQAVASALSPSDQAPTAPADTGLSELLELDEELKRIIEKTKDASYIDDPLGIAVPITGEKKQKSRKKR